MIRTVTRNDGYAGAHPAYCTCRDCTPKHPSDQGIHPAAYIIGFGLLILAILVTL